MNNNDKKIFTIITIGLIIVFVGGFLLISFILDNNDINNIANNINNPSDNGIEAPINGVAIDNSVGPGGIPAEKNIPKDEVMITETTKPDNNPIDEKIE